MSSKQTTIGRWLSALFAEERRPAPPPAAFDSRRMLLRLSATDVWTMADSFEGTQIFGATGSGKTSGSGATLARAFLKAGYGGLVLTIKTDEAPRWEALAAATGRSGDVIEVTLGGRHRFNFLDYEACRPGGNRTENLVQIFLNVAEIQERQASSGANESFWRKTLEQLTRNTIDLLRKAGKPLTLTGMYEVISSAPRDIAAANAPAFMQRSRCLQTIDAALARSKAGYLDHQEILDLDLTLKYWLAEFPTFNDRTRSIIIAHFTALIDGLQRGDWRDMFSTETTFTPEDALAGKIIVLNMPAKTALEAGLFAQVILKYAFQRAWERRIITDESRPVFLWADESQYFLTSYDREFLTTARSSRVATVLLTQNIANYYASIRAKSEVRAEVDALLGNLSTKIFHSNSDKVTNEWAADTIGKAWQMRVSFSEGESEGRSTEGLFGRRPDTYTSQHQTNRSFTPDLNYQVLPRDFMQLQKGGPASDFKVEAIVLQSGRVWRANGRNYLKVQFNQHPKT